MSDPLPDFAILSQLLDSNVSPAPNVLGVSKKANLQQNRHFKGNSRDIAYKIIDLRYSGATTPSKGQDIADFTEAERTTLVSKAFEYIYSIHTETSDGYAVIKKHQTYIVQLISSKRFEAAIRELEILSTPINGLIDDLRKLSPPTDCSSIKLLSAIPFPSSLDKIPAPQTVNIIISFYFLAQQSYLQYTTANLKTISQNKDAFLNLSIFVKIALTFHSDSMMNKWLHHSYCQKPTSREKHFQNYHKIVCGFIKILQFVTSKLDSLELRTARSLFEIKLLEIQYINNKLTSTHTLNGIEINYLSLSFLEDLETTILNQDASPTSNEILDRIRMILEKTSGSCQVVSQKCTNDLILKWSSFCESPNLSYLSELSSVLLTSNPSSSLFDDLYFLRTISKSTKSLLSSTSELINHFFDVVIAFVTNGLMSLNSLTPEHLHFLDNFTIYCKNRTCTVTNESLKPVVGLLNGQFKIYTKFGEFTRIRNLSHILFNLGKQLQSLECFDKALSFNAFILKNATDKKEEDLESLQIKVEKIVNLLHEASRYNDCCCILNSFLAIMEESKFIHSTPLIISLAAIDMPLITHVLAKCLVANRDLSSGLLGDCSKFSTNMKCFLFIKLCHFFEKISDHEQKILMINSLAQDLNVSDVHSATICEYHFIRSCGMQSNLRIQKNSGSNLPLFEAGLVLLTQIYSDNPSMGNVKMSIDSFKNWILLADSQDRIAYAVYEVEILKIMTGFLNFNAMFLEMIELLDLYIPSIACKTPDDSQVLFHLYMEGCDAALESGDTERSSAYLKAAGLLLKSLSSFTDDKKRLTKITGYDIAKWKLFQIQCCLNMKNMEQAESLFESTLNFVKSKPEFDVRNNGSSVPVEARFNNLIILALLNSVSCNLHSQYQRHANALIDSKKVLKILHSVLTKIPHNVSFLFRHLVRWTCTSLLLRTNVLILKNLGHSGLTKDVSYYIYETRKLLESSSSPNKAVLTSHFLARLNVLTHNFSVAESDIEYGKQQSDLLLCPSNMKFVEDQSTMVYNEVKSGVCSLEVPDEHTVFSLFNSLPDYRKSVNWNVITKQFPLLDCLHTVSLSKKNIPHLSDFEFPVEKRSECLKTLLIVKHELLAHRHSLSLDPFMSVMKESPIAIPCVISKSVNDFNAGENTGLINKLLHLKSMLFRCIASGYLDCLSVHELHDFSKYFTECLCELSFLTAFKSTSSKSLTGLLFYIQDLAKSLPFMNESKIQELQNSNSEIDSGLIPKAPPLTASGFYSESAEKKFVNDLKDVLPQQWSVITLDISPISGDLIISKFNSHTSSSPLLVRLPLSRSYSRHQCDFEFTFQTLKEEFEDLIKQSDSSTKRSTTSQIKSKEDRRKWWKLRFSLDMRLKNLLDIVENRWIGGFKGIFSPVFKLDEDLYADFVDDFKKIWKSALKTKSRDLSSFLFSDSVVRLFYDLDDDSNHTLYDREDWELEDLLYFMLDVVSSHARVNAIELVDVEGLSLSLKELSRSYSTARASMRSYGSNEHIILIPSSKCHFFPWESLTILRERSVSRMPSIRALIDTLKLKGANDLTVLNQERNSLYYLINPGGDLTRTEGRFGPIFSSLSGVDVSGHIGSKPDENDLLSQLMTKDLFVFLGHGGCEQYIRTSSLFRTKFASEGSCLPPSLLIGCSSGHLSSHGFLEPSGNAYNWLLCGAPMMVVNLWDVTDKDIDLFSLSVFQKWGLVQESSNQNNLNICKAVAASRDECTLKYLNGSAPIVYGLPLMLR